MGLKCGGWLQVQPAEDYLRCFQEASHTVHPHNKLLVYIQRLPTLLLVHLKVFLWNEKAVGHNAQVVGVVMCRCWFGYLMRVVSGSPGEC